MRGFFTDSVKNARLGLLITGLAAVLLIAAPSAAFGQVTWDATPGSIGAQDGSGTCSTADSNWWSGTTNVVWPNLTSSTATFGAGSGAAGTVTVSGSGTANRITFATPGSGN